MQSQRYSLNQYPIEILLNWIEFGEIAIPEIQRPFVWTSTKVCDFIDSLYHGYPVGYLITWPKSGVSLREGASSTRERILIDGQQRMMALRAALLGKTIFDKKYNEKSIRIAFHPNRGSFAVATASIRQDSGWIPDISTIFRSNTSQHRLIDEYCEANDGVDRYRIADRIDQLCGIRGNSLGVVELSANMDVETVVEIFVRINQTGVRLSSADFIMSKMAASEQHNGHLFRQSIDYFCHLTAVPDAYSNLAADADFARTDYFRAMEWLKDWHDDLYIPTYTDMLRVIFTSEFRRGDLSSLVNLLSGDSAESAFHRLGSGIRSYINETNFKRFIMILRSAGFVDASMITARNAVNSAYILFLTLRAQNVNSNLIEKLVRRWFVMSVLTGRYSGEPQSTLGEDIRGMTAEDGTDVYLDQLERTELSEAFWTEELPQKMNASGSKNVYFNVFLASQVRGNDKGFLSRDIIVRDLLGGQRDVHHIFPQSYLRELGVPRSHHNQLANLVVMQREINIAIGGTAPAIYFSELWEGCRNREPHYGGIDNSDELQANLAKHCIPFNETDTAIFENYDEFLEKRRKFMVARIRDYYQSL
jgi:hypothetical protein